MSSRHGGVPMYRRPDSTVCRIHVTIEKGNVRKPETLEFIGIKTWRGSSAAGIKAAVKKKYPPADGYVLQFGTAIWSDE